MTSNISQQLHTASADVRLLQPLNASAAEPQTSSQPPSTASFAENWWKCDEVLTGRGSPEVWPELVPGYHRVRKQLDPEIVAAASKMRTDLDKDDVRLVQELGHLSADSLMEHIRRLQNQAYLLGLEEAKQMDRALVLHIFDDVSSDNSGM